MEKISCPHCSSDAMRLYQREEVRTIRVQCKNCGEMLGEYTFDKGEDNVVF